MQCPKCQAEMRDLRPKASPKAPDFVCDTEGCGAMVKGTWRQTAKWLDQSPKAAPGAPQAQRQGPKWTWMTLSKTYERSLLTAEMRVLACGERLGVKATIADVLQATATLFIEAARGGVEEPKVKLPPKPPEPATAPVDEEWEVV